MPADRSTESKRDTAERALEFAAACAQFVAGLFVLAAIACGIRAFVISADARAETLLAYIGSALGCLVSAVAFNLAAKAAAYWIASRGN